VVEKIGPSQFAPRRSTAGGPAIANFEVVSHAIADAMLAKAWRRDIRLEDAFNIGSRLVPQVRRCSGWSSKSSTCLSLGHEPPLWLSIHGMVGIASLAVSDRGRRRWVK